MQSSLAQSTRLADHDDAGVGAQQSNLATVGDCAAPSRDVRYWATPFRQSPQMVRAKAQSSTAAHMTAGASNGNAEPRELFPPTRDAETAFRLYSQNIATLAFRLLGREDEADDLVQDVFVTAARSIADLQDPKAVLGWLQTITVRLAYRRLRKRALMRLVGFDEAFSYEHVASVSTNPEQRAMVTELYKALDHVPAVCRVPWLLRYGEQLSLPEIAATCDCSLASAKRRISKAQDILRAKVGHR